MLLVFAYGGFETALTPLGEAKNPRRDAVFALFTGLITCTLLYTAIQWVVIGVLPDPAHSERPLADVARLAFGPGGAAFVSVGALVSVYGYLSANMLGVPRITFALAENGDFPAIFSRDSSSFPHALCFDSGLCPPELAAGAAWEHSPGTPRSRRWHGFSITDWFARRFRYFAASSRELRCFAFPAGTFFAVLGAGICLVLITGVNLSGSLILLATALVALVNWWWCGSRRRDRIKLCRRVILSEATSSGRNRRHCLAPFAADRMFVAGNRTVHLGGRGPSTS